MQSYGFLRRAEAARIAREGLQQARHATIPLRLDVAYGKLMAYGGAGRLRGIGGATVNESRRCLELSLTLHTLRQVRAAVGYSKQEFVDACSPTLIKWARAAGRSEQAVKELHAKLDTGYRFPDLPWTDKYGHPETGQYREPFDHQRVMATAMILMDGTALLADVGTAKTRPVLEAAQRHVATGAVDVILTTCPLRVMGTWSRETDAWTTGLAAIRLEGSVSARERVIRDMAAAGPAGVTRGTVLIVNHDVLARLEPAIKALASRLRVGFVVDEAHKFRNPAAQRTKAATRIAQLCPWRVIMTGTPVISGPENVWSQWYCVDLGLEFSPNNVQFRREYFDVDWSGFNLIPKPGAVERINHQLQLRGLRYAIDDCIDLPPALPARQECEMTRAQKIAYEDMAQHLLVELARIDAEEEGRRSRAQIQLTMLLRLSQITSGHIPMDDGTVHYFTPNPKLDLLQELVREALGEESAIIWAWYNEDVEAICTRLADLRPGRIVGGISLRESDRAEREFQDGTTRLIVCNPASGGSGLTLTAASQSFYFSQGYSLEHRLQSKGRMRRPGSERHRRLLYTDLVCRNTIDEAVLAALDAKLEVADAVVEFRRHLQEVA